MEDIKIKDEDVPRLIIDLLIKNSIQLKILQDLMIMTLGATSPDQNRDTIVKDVSNSLVENYKKERGVLLTEIYKQYGHIDLEGLYKK